MLDICVFVVLPSHLTHCFVCFVTCLSFLLNSTLCRTFNFAQCQIHRVRFGFFFYSLTEGNIHSDSRVDFYVFSTNVVWMHFVCWYQALLQLSHVVCFSKQIYLRGGLDNILFAAILHLFPLLYPWHTLCANSFPFGLTCFIVHSILYINNEWMLAQSWSRFFKLKKQYFPELPH